MRGDVGVDKRIDLVRIDNPRDLWTANVRSHEFELVDRHGWLLEIDADHRFDFVVVLETLGDSQSQVVRNPCDEDALASVHSSLVFPRPAEYKGLYPIDGPTMIVEPAAACSLAAASPLFTASDSFS